LRRLSAGLEGGAQEPAKAQAPEETARI
jgi:hypothetical protein